MKNRYSVNEIPYLKNKKIFFDANVLIYVFWPTTPDNTKAKNYLNVFSKLLKNNISMFIDFIVLSEVINRILKIEYNNISNHEKENFKEFRNSIQGREIISTLYTQIKNKIIPNFSIIGKIFTKENLENFLENFSLDFNDNAIVSICKDNNFILCTNDFDFANEDIDILTANPKFFQKR